MLEKRKTITASYRPVTPPYRSPNRPPASAPTSAPVRAPSRAPNGQSVGAAPINPSIAAPPRPPMGTMTQQFFAVGEEQEATNYENARLTPDDEPMVSPDLRFDSFDRVPRRRRPMLVVMTLVAGAVGFAAWRTHGHVLETGRSVSAFAAAMLGGARSTATPPAPAPAEQPAAVTATASPSSPGPTEQAAAPQGVESSPAPAEQPAAPQAMAAPPAPEPAEQIAAPAAALAFAPPSVSPRTPTTAAAAGAAGHPIRRDASARSRSSSRAAHGRAVLDRPPPVRGYVWSPTARALVPTGQALASDPVEVPRDGLLAPTELTASAKTSAKDSNSDSDDVRVAPATPSLAHPSTGIAPADVGSVSNERAAPAP